MRKLILKMDLSLDGFVGGPNGESDWIFETLDEGCTIWELEAISQAGLHVMGRKTFESMASYWPSSTNPFAAAMNSIPKLVFSRSGKIDFDAVSRAAPPPNLRDANADVEKRQLKSASPEETRKNQQSWRDPIVADDIVAEITRQKAQPGKSLIAYGGATFARELIKHDLIDEYRLVIHPVALGKGLAIFDGLEKPRALKLVSSSAFPGGATAKIYARDH
ncbi:MAG TPA: dihydrofolate reductase family protein [Polyangia bacterium]|jgi:dihydrofolate reductase